MKPLLKAGIIVASGLALACCVTYNPTQVKRDDSVVYPIELDFHDGPGTAIYYLNQEDIEKRLAELSGRYHREDKWMFVDGSEPRLVDIGDSYTIGTKVRRNGRTEILLGAASIASSYNTIERFLKPDDTVTFIHNHPGEDPAEVLKSYDYIPDFIFAQNFPSAGDYVAHHRLKQLLEGKEIKVNPSMVVGTLFTVSYDIDRTYRPKALERELSRILQSTIYCVDDKSTEQHLEEYIAQAHELGIRLKIERKNHPF